MSRTDNTRPFKIQVADLNSIKARGVKLVDLDDVIDSDTRPKCWVGVGGNNRGNRRWQQTQFSRQRRRRDRHACHMATLVDYDVDIVPVDGDRTNVSWYLD